MLKRNLLVVDYITQQCFKSFTLKTDLYNKKKSHSISLESTEWLFTFLHQGIYNQRIKGPESVEMPSAVEEHGVLLHLERLERYLPVFAAFGPLPKNGQ